MTGATYSIDDPRPVQKEAPYTFFLPGKERLAALDVGDLVQLIFRPIPNDWEYDAERMWVEVLEINGDHFVGNLDNEPSDMPQLKCGERVEFERFQIIDTLFAGKEKSVRHFEKVRGYWDRCLVDKAVLEGTARVQYLYREEPESDDEDKFPDSGWRFRAHIDQMTQEDYDEPRAAYIALGKVLNADDSWLHLIDMPVSSHFFLNDATGEFEACDK